MAAAESEVNVPSFGKFLASTDKKTRDKAIKNLTIFLSDPARDALSKGEMAKLWKGIFYCFWMSDKPLVQQALASELAEILLSIKATTHALAFLRGFWEATVREWNGIDRLRIDKYYMLVRRFVNATFRLLHRNEWEEDVCDEYNAILTSPGGPLCPSDIRVPTSLAYHLADIYLEELDKVLENSPAPSTAAPLSTILSPFFLLAARTTTSMTYKRIQSALLDPLLYALRPARDDEPPSHKRPRLSTPTYPALVANSCASKPKEGALKSEELRTIILKQLFDIASKPDTRDASRRRLYAVWKNNTDDDGDDSADST